MLFYKDGTSIFGAVSAPGAAAQTTDQAKISGIAAQFQKIGQDLGAQSAPTTA
jgi:hypothetical protein